MFYVGILLLYPQLPDTIKSVVNHPVSLKCIRKKCLNKGGKRETNTNGTFNTKVNLQRFYQDKNTHLSTDIGSMEGLIKSF